MLNTKLRDREVTDKPIGHGSILKGLSVQLGGDTNNQLRLPGSISSAILCDSDFGDYRHLEFGAGESVFHSANFY